MCGAVVLGKPEPLVAALALLGGAYAVILAIDEPPLDGRSAIVGALMLAVGELGYLSLGARSAVTDEAGTLARRIAGVMTLALLALAAGATVLIVVDVFRTGGIVVEARRGRRGSDGRRPARAGGAWCARRQRSLERRRP